MVVMNKKEPLLLFLGDLVILAVSLWLALLLRSGHLPSLMEYYQLFFPFSILFVIWTVVFFIGGLYENHTVIFTNKLPGMVFSTQVFNIGLAVIFFYFIPYFGVTPKTILFIYLVVSFILIFIWRVYSRKIFGLKLKEKAFLVASGEELKSLFDEVNNNSRYNLQFVAVLDLDKVENIDWQEDLIDRIYREGVTTVVIDLQHEKIDPILPHLYNLLFMKIKFVDMHKVYEDIFDRVPLSLVRYNWFLENISSTPSVTYDALKRAMDLIFSLVLGLISLIFYPLVWLMIKLDDHGPLFIVQNRIGKNNQPIEIIKFRTMSFNDNEQTENKKGNKITRAGAFLRRSRLDELPQLWNVFRGDLSLIGPRPELPALAQIYEKEVPYYNVRHLIKPGLSGWAQLYHENHPHQGANTEETKNKLSYDLYYVKNRSLGLDFKIALKTIKALLSRTGI